MKFKIFITLVFLFVCALFVNFVAGCSDIYEFTSQSPDKKNYAVYTLEECGGTFALLRGKVKIQEEGGIFDFLEINKIDGVIFSFDSDTDFVAVWWDNKNELTIYHSIEAKNIAIKKNKLSTVKINYIVYDK